MTTDHRLFLAAAPLTFVLLWSTGWIVAKYAAPYADPLTFLALRFLFAGGALAVLAFAMRAAWPRTPREIGHALVSGVLLHGVYLAGVWWAIAHGLPAGISALIAALQPILTALAAPAILGERIALRRWVGIALGFIGIGLVLAPKLAAVPAAGLSVVILPLLVNIGGVVSVTAASFHQKRFLGTGDLRTMTVLQYAGGLLFVLPMAWLTEPMRVEWNATLVLTMAWSVIVLSMGAVALLLLLIRKGAVSKAATLIYLVPPTAALMAFVLFGETLTAVQIGGMVITAAGVALANRG